MLPRLLSILLTALTAIAADNAPRDRIAELLQHRQWAEAQTLLEQVTAAEPGNAEAWSSLTQVHLARGNPDQAVAAAEKLTTLAGTKSDSFLQLGNAYGLAALKAGLFSKVGFAKKCKAAYDKAVELDPANINARWSVMEYCKQAPGMLGGGMDLAYIQAAEIKKLDARRGRAAYASLYLAEKKYADAFGLYDEVLRETPDDADALYQVGRLAARSGEQLDRGLAALRKVLALPDRPADARAHTLVGTILEKQGDKPGAKAAYEAAIAIDPAFVPALEALRKLNAG